MHFDDAPLRMGPEDGVEGEDARAELQRLAGDPLSGEFATETLRTIVRSAGTELEDGTRWRREHARCGTDGYPAGWVAAMWTGGRITWATAPVAGIDALCPADAVTGIDMPLGLLDRGLRECDALARHELVDADHVFRRRCHPPTLSGSVTRINVADER